MREVFGERGILITRGRASHKTDRSRGCRQEAKPRQNEVNTGGFEITGYPRRGDRGGDRVHALSQRALSLKKSSSGVKECHQSSLDAGERRLPRRSET